MDTGGAPPLPGGELPLRRKKDLYVRLSGSLSSDAPPLLFPSRSPPPPLPVDVSSPSKDHLPSNGPFQLRPTSSRAQSSPMATAEPFLDPPQSHSLPSPHGRGARFPPRCPGRCSPCRHKGHRSSSPPPRPCRSLRAAHMASADLGVGRAPGFPEFLPRAIKGIRDSAAIPPAKRIEHVPVQSPIQSSSVGLLKQ